MLRVSRSQMAHAAQYDAARFYADLRAELAAFMAREMPDVPADEAHDTITHAFHLCQHYGMRTEAEITRLSHILVTFPREFYYQPEYAWLHDLLVSPEPAPARLDRISACLGAAGDGR